MRNLRDYFQTQGFFAAQVRWERQFDQSRRHLAVVYKVDLGMRQKLVAIHIEGNKSFDTELVRERMRLKTAGNLLTHGLYSESLLKRDVEEIEQTLYKGNGFSQVKINSSVDRSYQGIDGHMLVTLRIAEGPQLRVASVHLLGNRSYDLAELEAHLAAGGAGLATVPGQPFSEANLAQDREVLLSFYGDNGFPAAQVEVLSSPLAGDPQRMDVVFSIREGDPVRVDRVLISGLNYTRPYVVRRVLQVQPGAPLSQSQMLDSQRSLYDLGLFTQVDAAVQNPEGNAPYKNVLFQIGEAKRWNFNYGIGFELQSGGESVDVVNSAPAPGASLPKGTTVVSSIPVGANPSGGTNFSPNVAFEVERINFRGTDHTISFKTHLGNLEKRALFSYTAPHWLNSENMRLSFSGLYDDSRDVRTFASQREQGSVQLDQTISRRADGEPITALLYRYSYRRVEVDANTLAISTELIPLLSKPVLLGIPSISYIRDRRDNVLDAHRGNYTTLDFAVSAKAFGSGSVKGTAEEISSGATTPSATAGNFTRLLVQNSTYAPVWRDWRTAPGRSIVLARTTQIGVENIFGAGASTALVPLPERFFMGGSGLLRGYALNQAGPRDPTTGFPLGGKASFLNSLELRFPPPTLPVVGDNLSFVLFDDAGNVFQSATEMVHSFSRWRQQDRSNCIDVSTYKNCRFDYMSQAFGTGVRYKTPIGPVRGDVSYNLSPPSFPYFVQCTANSSLAACHVPNANGLPTLFEHANLRHFNFVFSIGQSF
jgi:outer membrane protein assembly factor BamA